MIKRTIPFVILCAIALLHDIANAKVLHRRLNILQSSVPDSKSLATDNMEFIYDFCYSVDTVSNSIDTRDKMMLQISPGNVEVFKLHQHECRFTYQYDVSR